MTAPRYSLRLSVRPLGKAPIAGLESMPRVHIGHIWVALKQSGDFLVFQAGDFQSDAEAEAFLPKLKGGLWNIALEHNIAFTPYFERREITWAKDPIAAARNVGTSFGISIEEPVKPLHGLSDDEGYTIFRADQNIKFLAMGGASATVSTGWDHVSRTLSAGIEQARVPTGEAESNLAIALDLYLSSFYETSVRARFLTLMMVLEVLAPVTQKHTAAVKLLTELQTAIDAQLSTEADPDARNALESLRRESDFRKETSIRRRVRQLVLEHAPLCDADRAYLAKEVVAAYDLRGTVVHTGAVDANALGAANDTALRAVKLILRGLLGVAVVPPQ